MKRRPLVLFALSLLAGPLAGCGGGGKPAGLPDAAAAQTGPAPAAPSAAGQARFTVLWPPLAASAHAQAGPRLIPAAANSIVVTLQLGAGQPLTQTLVRPPPVQLPYPGGSIPQPIPTTATFDNLPIGTYAASAVAHPNPDGTGVAQARASVPLTIAAGQVTPFSLTMGSAIARVAVTPNPTSVTVGQTTALTATAYDGSGSVVLTSAFAWTSGNTSEVTVNSATGQLSGISATPSNPPAPVQVTATEPESGVSGTSDVIVQPAPVVLR